MDSPLWIYLIGLSAQVFFTGRVLVQWYLSEKHHKVEAPVIFWILSILGSMLLFVYGVLRRDFSIIFGELLAYYIYMWNLHAKGFYKGRPAVLMIVQALIPPAACLIVFGDIPRFASELFSLSAISAPLLILGTVGQLIFKLRFVYQWFYCVRRKESLLPLNFWILSVVGSALIIIYALLRHDWVLLVGQCGIVPAVRNIMISLASDEKADK